MGKHSRHKSKTKNSKKDKEEESLDKQKEKIYEVFRARLKEPKDLKESAKRRHKGDDEQAAPDHREVAPVQKVLDWMRRDMDLSPTLGKVKRRRTRAERNKRQKETTAVNKQIVNKLDPASLKERTQFRNSIKYPPHASAETLQTKPDACTKGNRPVIAITQNRITRNLGIFNKATKSDTVLNECAEMVQKPKKKTDKRKKIKDKVNPVVTLTQLRHASQARSNNAARSNSFKSTPATCPSRESSPPPMDVDVSPEKATEADPFPSSPDIAEVARFLTSGLNPKETFPTRDLLQETKDNLYRRMQMSLREQGVQACDLTTPSLSTKSKTPKTSSVHVFRGSKSSEIIKRDSCSRPPIQDHDCHITAVSHPFHHIPAPCAINHPQQQYQQRFTRSCSPPSKFLALQRGAGDMHSNHRGPGDCLVLQRGAGDLPALHRGAGDLPALHRGAGDPSDVTMTNTDGLANDTSVDPGSTTDPKLLLMCNDKALAKKSMETNDEIRFGIFANDTQPNTIFMDTNSNNQYIFAGSYNNEHDNACSHGNRRDNGGNNDGRLENDFRYTVSGTGDGEHRKQRSASHLPHSVINHMTHISEHMARVDAANRAGMVQQAGVDHKQGQHRKAIAQFVHPAHMVPHPPGQYYSVQHHPDDQWSFNRQQPQKTGSSILDLIDSHTHPTYYAGYTDTNHGAQVFQSMDHVRDYRDNYTFNAPNARYNHAPTAEQSVFHRDSVVIKPAETQNYEIFPTMHEGGCVAGNSPAFSLQPIEVEHSPTSVLERMFPNK